MTNKLSAIINAIFTALLSFCLMFCLISSFKLNVNTPILAISTTIFSTVFALISAGVKGKVKFLLSNLAIWGVYILVILLKSKEIILQFVLLVSKILNVYSEYISVPSFLGGTHLENTNYLDNYAFLLNFTNIFVLLSVLLCGIIGISLVRWNNTLSVAFISILMLSPCFVLVNTLPAIIPLIIAISLIFTLYLTAHIRKNNPKAGAAVMSVFLAVLIATSSVICLLNPVENYQRSQWQTDALEAAEKLLGFSDNSKSKARDFTASFSETEDLTSVGMAKLRGKAVMTALSNVGGEIYLRGTAYADYKNNKWTILDDDLMADIPEDFDSFTLTKSVNTKNIEDITISTINKNEIIYTPYFLESLPETYTPFGDVCIKNPDENTSYDLSVYLYDLSVYLSSQIEKELEFFNPNNTDRAFVNLNDNPSNQKYRDFVYNTYLQLPDDTKDELITIAEENYLLGSYNNPTANEEEYSNFNDEYSYIIDDRHEDYEDIILKEKYHLSNKAIASAVKNFVSNSATYSLDTPLMPNGADFPVWFLNESDTGFCVHFATSATLMLRALGVPARYVTGYYANINAGKKTTITSNNAHAWVEYYDDEIGWVPLEATPASFEPYPAPSTQSGTVNKENETTSATQPTTSKSKEKSSKPKVNYDVPRIAINLSVSTLILFVLFLLIRFAIKTRLQKRSFTSGTTNQRGICIYRYIQKIIKCSHNVVPDRIVSIAEKAKFSPHHLKNSEVELLLDFALEERKELYNNNCFIKNLYFKFIKII